MDLSRRRLFALGVVAAAGAAVGTFAEAWPAGAAEQRWLLPRSAFGNLSNTSLGGSPAVCQNAFNQDSTWFSAPYSGRSAASPVPKGYKGVAVLKFGAYRNGSTGLADVIGHGLPSWVQAVQYDSEQWAQTPAIEQGAWLYNAHAGKSFAQRFCALAHAHGLRVVLSPGNDLCNNSANKAYPGDAAQYPVAKGQKNYTAYVSRDLASAAKWLSAGDMYEYQAQILELDASLYRSVTTKVARQVGAARPGVIMMAGIGRTGSTWDGATAARLAAAASSVRGAVSGFWPNVDASAQRVKPMISLLRSLGY